MGTKTNASVIERVRARRAFRRGYGSALRIVARPSARRGSRESKAVAGPLQPVPGINAPLSTGLERDAARLAQDGLSAHVKFLENNPTRKSRIRGFIPVVRGIHTRNLSAVVEKD